VIFLQLLRHAKFAGLALSESSILLLSAYLCYLIADAAMLSGIISLLFFGQTAAHYSFYSLSAEVKLSSRHFIKVRLRVVTGLESSVWLTRGYFL